MDKKSKILLIVLALGTIASVGYTFYKTVIKQDFEVINTEPAGDEEVSGEEGAVLQDENLPSEQEVAPEENTFQKE